MLGLIKIRKKKKISNIIEVEQLYRQLKKIKIKK